MVAARVGGRDVAVGLHGADGQAAVAEPRVDGRVDSCDAGEASTSLGYERRPFVRSTVAAVVAVTAAPGARATTTSFHPTRSVAYVDV